ncbi:DUF86 domain-containing protein [Synechocystis sp. PCC 7339]|uniref:HepT-like ribonuclease domain-containing protein n=1 Tax=unclassified Synechocystis TaxID=2640012 RepID=UPI001BAF187F|nr:MULTISPECIES: HepT-like ribonuclease domain-containing protein [unclassified Synechocystis]QUS61665.1 DUF86 domain-containing protein [Synechocystis sp. PCC 7338]UAJ73864.1 DUF86 domain-containing protein [Synechocystis sp. PCC 7339]
MQTRELSYPKDMLNAAKLVQSFTMGISLESFQDNLMCQSAVTRQLEIIGEAPRRISVKSKEAITDIPWRQVIGMRHRIGHEYDRLNIDRIWQTVQFSLPPLIIALESIIESGND